MGLIEFAVAKALASSAVFLFVTVLLMAIAKRVSTCIIMFGLQSAIMTAQIVAIAWASKSTEAYAIAVLMLGVKVIGIPYSLVRIIKDLKAAQDVTSSTTASQSVFIMAGLILLSFFAVAPYAKTLRVDEEMLAAAVALLLAGAFLMVSRKKALMQIIGLLVLENGIFLAAFTTTFGMPLIIEIGVFFDLLMGVLLMGLFIFRIRDTFDHLDVSKLRKLRG